jgi:hypothetical protein
MAAPTIYLSRLIGIVALILAAAMLTEKANFVATAQAVLQDRPLVLLVGIINVVIGAAIVLMHNFWNRGLWPLLVTLVGWMLLLRGVVILLLPPEMLVPAVAALHFKDFFYVYAAIPVVLGAYLCLRGFMAQR